MEQIRKAGPVDWLAFVLALILCPISLLAEDDLKTYQATYNERVKAIREDRAGKMAFLDIQYEKGLSALNAKFQGEGNLAKIKKVASELTRFTKEKGPPRYFAPNQLAEISKLQTIYFEQALRLQKDATSGIVTLTKQYDRTLINHQKTLVQSGQLDLANLAQRERNRVKDKQSGNGGIPSPRKPIQLPADAKSFGGNWYKVYAKKTGWFAARAKCRALGGHLAIINNAEEHDFLVELVKKSPKQGAFIGATDVVKEGKWLWVDGSPMKFKKWKKGQPDNAEKREHFLLLKGAWWEDRRKQPIGSVVHAYICEWDR